MVEHEINEVEVSEASAGKRADAFLSLAFAELSRSKIKKLIDDGQVTLRGEPIKPRYLVEVGDVLVLEIPPPEPVGIEPVSMDLKIVFEDPHLVVIDKPMGLAVHPGAGIKEPTLVHGLVHHFKELAREGLPPDRPGIVHRLDKDTTGVMVCAKTDFAHAHLARQFHDKTNDRQYLALLEGLLKAQKLRIESYLRRDPKNRLRMESLSPEEFADLQLRSPSATKSCRFAASHFAVKATFQQRLTLAEVRLETGRTHQIRAHAEALGAPVVGDQRYGRRRDLPQTFDEVLRRQIEALPRQMLHAALLGFEHPVSGERLTFTAQPPQDFEDLLRQLAFYEDH